MLRLIDSANETGRWCAQTAEDPGSHLSQSKDGPRFHFAFGFRTTQRLARMLDSLVRVSRRVGWRTDRFATDPVLAGPPHPSQEAVKGHGCPVSPSRTSREGEAAYASGGSSVPEQIGTGEAITVSGCPQTYLPRRLLTAREPVVALCLRKVHTADQRPAEVESHKDLHYPSRRRPSELNSAGRLCGSTRLPVCGFTYC